MPTTSDDAAVLLAYDGATTGFGWSRPGRSTRSATPSYTLRPCGTIRRRRGTGWTNWSGTARARHGPAGIGGVRELSELSRWEREAEERSALHVTQPDRAPWSTTRRGTRSSGPVAHGRGGRQTTHPGSDRGTDPGTTPPTTPGTWRRSGRGWRRKVTSARRPRHSTCIRTPSVTACAGSASGEADLDDPRTRLALLIALAASE